MKHSDFLETQRDTLHFIHLTKVSFCIQAFCIWKHCECWAFRVNGLHYIPLDSPLVGASFSWFLGKYFVAWVSFIPFNLNSRSLQVVAGPGCLVSIESVSWLWPNQWSEAWYELPLLGWACNKTCSHNHNNQSLSSKQSFTTFQDSLKIFRNPYKHAHKLLAVSFFLFTLSDKRALSNMFRMLVMGNRISSLSSVQKMTQKSIRS